MTFRLDVYSPKIFLLLKITIHTDSFAFLVLFIVSESVFQIFLFLVKKPLFRIIVWRICCKTLPFYDYCLILSVIINNYYYYCSHKMVNLIGYVTVWRLFDGMTFIINQCYIENTNIFYLLLFFSKDIEYLSVILFTQKCDRIFELYVS